MTTATARALTIDAAGITLDGDLLVPDASRGVVLFAHGSGSSRHSPRNKQVATALNELGLATLLMDLLTLDEEAVDRRTRHLRFDVEFLAQRLAAAATSLAAMPHTQELPIGYFGASTGAAAALIASAHEPSVRAVVSRGGRPDLAGEHLRKVTAPTLLIVGSRDESVLELNRAAYDELAGPRQLEIVAGATHLFEESGALEQVAALAGDWFLTNLASHSR